MTDNLFPTFFPSFVGVRSDLDPRLQQGNIRNDMPSSPRSTGSQAYLIGHMNCVLLRLVRTLGNHDV
jgi:hypothetical protein